MVYNLMALKQAFFKYSQDQHLDKTQFKCAFIFMTGFKPTKQDVAIAKKRMAGPFEMNYLLWEEIMTAYLE